MAIKLDWDIRAINVLNSILEWQIDNRSQKQANKFYAEVMRSVNKIVSHPLIGHVDYMIDDDRFEYRTFAITKHFRIIYYIEEKVIHIIYIWDCRRDFENIFTEE